MTQRVVGLWLLIHTFVFAALSLAQGASGVASVAPDPVRPNPAGVTVVCALLVLADVRRRGERALWGNLGLSTTQLTAICLGVCAIGETLLALARR